MTKIINLTSHEIRVINGTKERVYHPSGVVARVRSKVEETDSANEIPIVTTKLTEIENLPDPEPDTYFIVSNMVVQAYNLLYGGLREDLISPDTGVSSAVRDNTGQIVAVRRFQRLMTNEADEKIKIEN